MPATANTAERLYNRSEVSDLKKGDIVTTKTNSPFGSNEERGTIDGFYRTQGQGGGEYALLDLGPRKIRARTTQCHRVTAGAAG